MDLVILEDDLGFFPPYDAALVARNEVLEEYPEVRDILEPLWGRFDEATMASLNAQVDVEERDYADVAREYLEAEGLID